MVNTGVDLGGELAEILGLPEHCRWFELRCHFGEVITIECEYYPDIKDIENLKPILSKYRLEKIESDETCSSNN